MTSISFDSTGQDATRRLSPTAVRTGPVLGISGLGMLAEHVRAEIRQNLRQPAYMIAVVAIPVLLFAMFGLPHAGRSCRAGPSGR